MSSGCKPPAISSMSKTQLLEECNRVGLVVHRTWTVEELKAVIQEHRMENAATQPSHQMKSVTSLNMPELKMKASEMGVEFPPGITKGNLLRLIRDSLATPATELMKIGKYKGYEFQEIPSSYGEWASKEVRTSGSPHTELVRYAKWWDNEKAKNNYTTTTIEENSAVPYPGTDADSMWGSSDWGPARPFPAGKSMAASSYQSSSSMASSRTNKRSGSWTKVNEMEAEVDEDTMKEIQALEAKLAVLKDKAKVLYHKARGITCEPMSEAARNLVVHYMVIFLTQAVFTEGDMGEMVMDYDTNNHYEANVITKKSLTMSTKDSDVGLHEAFISAQEFSQALLNKNVNYACAPALCDDHDPFVKACNEQDFSFQRLRQLLEGAGLKKVRTERGDVIGGTGTMANYNTIGLFIHGGVYGITTRTKEHNSMTRYLNQFGRYHLGDQATWTSVTIAHNTETAIHHDFHNLEHSENYVVSFGQKKGGGLWVEDKSVTQERANNGNIQWRRDKSGRWLPGFVVDTKQKFLSFSPFLKHATEPWEGDRWCLVYHSTRNYAKIDDNLHAYLKKCCFPLPRRRRSTLAEPSPKKPSISTRRSIFNNAAKISVMMTTFLAAATSYLAGTVQVVHNDPHPVVLFEVGGTRVTEEAVMLGKDVFEPMDWDTYASPEGKETAYHVINGGLPKELRINLDGKRDGDNQAIAELLLQQVGVGGTAVLEGGMSDSLFGNHYFVTEVSKHLQYSSCNDGRQTMIFYKADHTKTKVKGPERVHRVCAVAVGADEAEAQRDVALDGTGVTFGEGTPPMIASALRRLHQNLGHPQNSDLIRHLRLAGCDGRILKAVRSLKCQVCDANVGPRIARPSVIPQLCDWNDTVGIDLFYAHDEKHTFLSAVDYGTSYHLAIRVDGQSSDDIEAKFNDMWIIPFGPPKSVVVDLDGGVQGALGRLCDWHNIAMKSIAAQSHWQAGMIERQQAWWKNVWERIVHELTITEDEVDIAVPIVNSAKNDLRRRCGHSPSQWVFGRAPRLPEDLQDPDGGNHVSWDVSEDSRFQRQPHEIGESVHFWHKPKNRRRGHWTGPAVIVGKEGNNYWISNNGRCRLTSPEHIRGSTPEEVGAYLSMKGTQREVEKLLECDPDGDEVFDEPDEVDDLYEPSEDMELDHDESLVLEPAYNEEDLPMPTRRLKRKTNVAALDEGTHKWSEIPDDVKEKFRDAERVQWEEHLSYDALEPLSTEESDAVRARIPGERILRSRWAYKDKNWARRREGEADVVWKCKSRLVIAGHTDPDLGNEYLSTDAPTLSRSGLACLLQLAANGLSASDPWGLSAGDIKCAFLTGSYLTRELYMHQPRTGFPNMLPGQLVRIKKNVFGLATSPHEWWGDLQDGFHAVKVFDEDGIEYRFDQCALDPCIFMLRRWGEGKFSGHPRAYVGCHVDDLLVVAPSSFRVKIEESLSATFPIDSWEHDQFEFLGSQIKVGDGVVQVLQEKYATTRLFLLDIPQGAKDDDPADEELVSDNRSLIGALSWMSAQSRPDLTCSVSMAQQLQKNPTIGDLRFTNATANKATQFKDQGLTFHPIDGNRIMLIVYHDAAWANVPEPDPLEDYYVLSPEDDLAGLQNEGPYMNEKQRKAKKGSSKVASQLGVLVTFADRGVLNNQPGNYSIADWKSRAGQRVCRSTFGAETQACAEGLETGQYIRSMLESLINGYLVVVEEARLPILCLSDCRSLYDHLNRQGIPRVPTDKRLAVDLAALRQALKSEAWSSELPIGWIPGSVQKGDVLTKPQNPAGWWESLGQKLVLPLALGRGAASGCA
ncbi:Copia protein [Symbiodinium microadriaticum]|uniref:Copia protein n=1 Tax=Symbiodinium microadriaticum TaxID=2951 RepID=A0A1Q9DCT3_SYMMI|nr:Copia protein [Symbiodinium microadriaticum]